MPPSHMDEMQWVPRGGGGEGGELELLKLRIDQCIKIQIFSPNCECCAVTF